jgi:hypothetical protein
LAAVQAITFSELQKTFSSRSIAAYGSVVVVPRSEFKIGWDNALGGEGCQITYLDVDDKPSVLVSPPKSVTSKEKHKRKLRLGSWKPAEIELLLEEYPKQKGTARQRGEALMPLFPGYSAMSIYQQYWKQLQTKKTSKDTTVQSEDGPEKPSEPEKESLSGLLKEIRDSLKPSTFSFDYACPEGCSFGTVNDAEKIWRCCPVCGKPLIVWNVEVD